MVVEDIMTVDPVTIEPTLSIRKAVDILFELDVRHLPVVEGARLVGIISDRDLRAFLAPSMLELERPNEVSARLRSPVSSIMNADVLSVEPESPVSEVIALMLEHKVGAVPVVREATDELLGIVSYVDVLRALEDALDE